MKRNTALFGASLVVGVAAAGGLLMTSTASQAAGTYYGVHWSDPTSDTGNSGWSTGAYGDSSTGNFWGTASAGSGTFQTVLGSQVSVSVTCDGANPVTTVTGGGAAGTYQAGQSVGLGKFVGDSNVNGTVTFGSVKSAGEVAGAYIDMADSFGPGTFVALAGADCSAAPTTTPTSPTTTPTTTQTSTPTQTSTSTGTSTPTGTSTGTPTTSPTTPPSTEPPTPTPTTTTLPVTG